MPIGLLLSVIVRDARQRKEFLPLPLPAEGGGAEMDPDDGLLTDYRLGVGMMGCDARAGRSAYHKGRKEGCRERYEKMIGNSLWVVPHQNPLFPLRVCLFIP